MPLISRFALGCVAALTASVALADAGHVDFGHPAPAAKADRTVEVDMGDMYFTPKALDVKAGETVHFVLVNKGQLLHEFNLGHAAMHSAHQQEMLGMLQSGMITPTGMGQMNHGGMKHDDPNSVLVEPGKTAELTWTFTRTAGLEFACNVPGHYQAGMVGQVKVQ